MVLFVGTHMYVIGNKIAHVIILLSFVLLLTWLITGLRDEFDQSEHQQPC
jgi:hypothetical protein